MLTKAEIEAIRERTEKAKIGNPLRDVDALVRKEEVINEDVPKLLAEIERLRDLLDQIIGAVYEHAPYTGLFDIAERIDDEYDPT